MGTSNLDDVFKCLRLGIERVSEFSEGRNERLVDFGNGSYVHCSGEPETNAQTWLIMRRESFPYVSLLLWLILT
jgi:hypothetical protein